MKKYRLFSLMLIALLIMSLVLAGCSNGQTQPAPKDTPPATDSKTPEPKAPDTAKEPAQKQRTEPFEIKMGSGPAGAVTDALYGAVFEDFKKNIPYLAGGPTTGAPAANVVGLVQKKYNIAHSLTDITGAGLAGEAFFKDTGAISGVSNLVTWWPMTSTLVVWADSPYQSLTDLKGKKVSPGPRMGSNDLELQRILKELGLSYKDFDVQFLGFNDAEQQMLDGHLDALLYAHTAFPHAGLLSIFAQKQVRLLPVPEEALNGVVNKYKGVEKSVLPEGVYTLKDGTKSPAMPGVGGYIHWLVRDDFPEDVAYDIVKSITENFERYQANFKNLKWMKIEDLAKEVPGIPLHPGAKKYFQERGFIK